MSNALGRLQDAQLNPLESIHESLQILGVVEAEWHDYLSATLLALRGWAGMIRQMELRGDRVVRPVPEGSLVEYLALRLVLERLALAETARNALAFTGPLSGSRDEAGKRLDAWRTPTVEQRAFVVFQLAQVLGWFPEKLHRLTTHEWKSLLQEIETFSSLERRRIFHRAYERPLYTRSLDAIALHVRKPAASPAKPRFQALFCIDEREESLRRHLEELAPDVETLSLAGFFFVPMYYRGAADAHFMPLCPAAIRPQHWVVEQVVDRLGEKHKRIARARRALGIASHHLHLGSRTFALGALLSTAVGVLASVPLIARVFSPRWTSRLRRKLGRFLQTPPPTRLHLEFEETTAPTAHGQEGFTLEEMTGIGERVLRDIGLTSGFARLVLVLGHGSTSMNNPHESAHDCGACGGARGGANARALAQILNDSRIRDRLRQRGIAIPPGTVFLGGLHNTSSEKVAFYDPDRLPASHRDEFESACCLLKQACDRNAHERSRRFASAQLSLTFEAARQHVEGRAEDLALVRPEWGHATNALSIVGRRSSTRGLFLDRRAFLTSYDPAQDDAEHTILSRVLQADFPVCAGINLEYYFSYVDNSGWGCGTKLSHNITSLVGVMDGAASDLRTGLPWQMVEIHEPLRLLNLIETTPEAMLQILQRNDDIAKLCRNGWVQLASLGGFGLVLRALEGRFGRLTLLEHHGLYEHSPALAVCFLLTGLASVGFPGTLGFVATDMLVDGAVTVNLFAGIAVVATTALNGIAVVRAYLLLFTGARHTSTVSLAIGIRERVVILTLTTLILGGGQFPQLCVPSRGRAADEVLQERNGQPDVRTRSACPDSRCLGLNVSSFPAGQE